MVLDNTSYISVIERIIAEFADTGPEAYDFGTPVLLRTRRSTLSLVVSFSGNPGNYDWGYSVSIDGINYVEGDGSITGSGANPVEIKIPNFPWAFIQPFQNSKDNDVIMTITAKLV